MTSNFASQILNQKIKWPMAIIGLGVTGKSLQNLLLKVGIPASQILLYDDKNPNSQFKNPEELLLTGKPNSLAVSPGISLKTSWIEEFKNNGGQITSELEISTYFLTTEKMIAVTGSLGKSTVVSLLGEGLKKLTPKGFVGGNLGTPLADYIIEILSRRARAPWIALELSSYQLENYKNLKASISAITYLSPNHLERYSSLDEYYQTKWNLLSQTKDSVFLNKNGGDLISWGSKQKLSHELKLFWTSRDSSVVQKYSLNESLLVGLHNLDNLALAASIAEHAGWPPESILALKQMRGLSHRIENLGQTKGVTYINDSKATSIESVLTAAHAALESLKGQNIFLMLGGRDKNLPWYQLMGLKKFAQFKFVFFGECSSLAKNQSQLDGPTFKTLKEAVHWSQSQAQKHDIILLSPGGTSLDEFKNFEDRGEFFKKMFLEACSK